MINAIRAGFAVIFGAMLFAGNAVAGEQDAHDGQDMTQTPTTKGMGVSSETTKGTATEGSTTSDDDSLTPEEAVEEGRTGGHQ
ncbi:MAG TPA: hypothetical protein PJ986_14725 [Gammaproteobacteria bacterium]|nr:hypothetical protein [Gammaproteobacteria bacterium]